MLSRSRADEGHRAICLVVRGLSLTSGSIMPEMLISG